MDESDVTLEFDAWAALSARLNGLAPDEWDAILDAKAMELEQWELEDAHWLGVLAEDIRRGDMARAKAYGSACVEQLARRPKDQETAALPIQTEDSGTKAGAAVGPAFLSTEAQSWRAEAAAVSLDVPAAVPGSEPDRIPVGPPSVVTPTSALPSYLINAPKDPAIRNLPIAPAPPIEDINATAELRAIPAGPALPFNKDAAPTPILPAKEAKPRPSSDQRDETAALPAILASNPILPFGQDARVPAPAAPADDGTAVEAGMLTLAQYASLGAELASLRQPRETVLLRYGLADEAARTRQEIYWARRMNKNEPLKTKFKELVTSFREHLERERGG